MARVNWAGLLIMALAVTSPAAASKTPVQPVAATSAPATTSVGAGVEKWRAGDYAAAVAIWRPFADAGDADAMFNIGQAYKLGRAVPKDEGQARVWYHKAALKGHRPAQANLGIMMFQAGEKTEAVRWLKAAADQNEMRAQYVLGVAYWNGDGAPRSLILAYAYLSRAGQLGLAEASNALGTLETRLSAIDRANGTAVAASLAAGNGVPAAFAGAAPISLPAGLAVGGRAEPPSPRAAAPVAAVSISEPAKSVQVAQAVVPPAPRPAPPPTSVAPSIAQVAPPALRAAPATPVVPAFSRPVAPASAPPAAPVVTAAPILAPRAPESAPPAKASVPVAMAMANPVVEKPKGSPVFAKPVVIAKPVVVAKPTSWRVQLGAYSKRALAEAAWTSVLAKQKKAVAGVKPIYEASGKVTKLQIGPYVNEGSARDACAKLAFSGNACFVTTG